MSESQNQAVRNRLQNVTRDSYQLNRADWNFEPTSGNGNRERFATFQSKLTHSLRPNRAIDFHIPAYETHDTAGGGVETVNLSHSITDAPAAVSNLVLYESGNRVEENSIDYANNQFEYDDGGTVDNLDIWYLSDEQAEIRLRLTAPKNHYNEPIVRDAGLMNLRDQMEDPVMFDPSDAFEGIAPGDYTFEWFVESNYRVRWDGDNNGTPDNLLLSLPVWRTNQKVPGLDDVKRRTIR